MGDKEMAPGGRTGSPPRRQDEVGKLTPSENGGVSEVTADVHFVQRSVVDHPHTGGGGGSSEIFGRTASPATRRRLEAAGSASRFACNRSRDSAARRLSGPASGNRRCTSSKCLPHTGRRAPGSR